jgi:hypothetical protein
MKIDYEELKVRVYGLTGISNLPDGILVLDQEDTRKFIIYASNGNVLTANVQGTRIVIGKTVKLDCDLLYYAKLNGNKLYGLRLADNMLETFEFKLDTLAQAKPIAICMTYGDDKAFNWRNIQVSLIYCL